MFAPGVVKFNHLHTIAMFIFVDFHIPYKMCRYVNNTFSCQISHVKLQFNCLLVISVKLKVTADLCVSALMLPYTYWK